ncbi:MAG: sigma 54-interacting transcriptional regulator [Planctomycetes bacterium]|nr:sigma 54-interacting transcriptional regulator [Planctomycetota bacterium]
MKQGKTKPTVLIGLLGPTLDQGRNAGRWERWRPSIALCQHEDLLVSRFELLVQPRFESLGKLIDADIRSVSPETEVRRHVLQVRDPWDFEEVYGELHDFARGYAFDTDREDYLIHITTGTHVAQICLFLLTETHYFPARLVQTEPPAQRASGEPGAYKIIDLDLSKYDRLASRFRKEMKEGASFLKSGIETRNAGFNKLIERIEQVAVASRAPLLLTGPTGAGKSLLARRIYELRKSRNLVRGSFVEVNCATLRGDAAMSALFGHEKGAFTGATRDREGLLRAADGGVLFLDEIGELGSDEQAMLLRAIEEKVFLPVGADREARSDFLLIAGTNRDLRREVAAGRFREDLLARIDMWTFRLPGLAERREDIAPNLDYELEAYARQSGQHVSFTREGRERFLAFARSEQSAWLGNFRDLNGAVCRMATLALGGRISSEGVEEEIERLRAAWKADPQEAGGDGALEALLGPTRLEELDLFDRLQLERVVEVCRRSRSLSDAGRRLFERSRAQRKTSNDADRLRKYLLRFGLNWDDLFADRGE